MRIVLHIKFKPVTIRRICTNIKLKMVAQQPENVTGFATGRIYPQMFSN